MLVVCAIVPSNHIEVVAVGMTVGSFEASSMYAKLTTAGLSFTQT